MKKKTRIHISIGSLGQLRTTHTRSCPDKMMCQICMFEDREAWSYNIKIKVNCKLNRNKVERLFVWTSLKDAHMAANSLSCWPQTLNVVTLQLRKRLKQHLHTYTTPTWLKYGGKYGQNGTNHDCFGTELEHGARTKRRRVGDVTSGVYPAEGVAGQASIHAGDKCDNNPFNESYNTIKFKWCISHSSVKAHSHPPVCVQLVRSSGQTSEDVLWAGKISPKWGSVPNLPSSE